LSVSTRTLDNLRALRGDYEAFAQACLKVKAKDGALVPFRFNRAQAFIHKRLEAQKARTGRVRALLLKARQQGFSTYIGGRYYHRTSLYRGVSTFILTHEQEATNNLFAMVERFHAHNPLAPSTSAANARELRFGRLDSGYGVGTAGTKAVGRSKTTQLLHGSEVAFWPNAASHFAGLVQTVPDENGTEIVLESTANGIGGEFHERWQMAEAGIGDYQAIFVPWFWSAEYTRRPEPGFTLDEDEHDYAARFDLSLGQMAWRRAKIAELKDPMLFRQEYPATAQEAFQTSGHDSFIAPDLVIAARRARLDAYGALVMGVDPARFGDDRFAVAFRQGRVVSGIESRSKIDTVAGANWVKSLIDRARPVRCFIDAGGVGGGVIDILHSWGEPYLKMVRAVNFGGAPMQPDMILPDGTRQPGPRNRRAEMWLALKDWLQSEGGVQLPDLDSLHADLCGPSYSYDSAQRLLLESKDHMRQRGVRSPDEGDAVALTFAEPVSDRMAARPLSIPDYGAV
jgi:hypothetical protein